MVQLEVSFSRQELGWFLGSVVSVLLLYILGTEFLFKLDHKPATLPIVELSEEREAELSEVNRRIAQAIEEGEALDVTLSSDLMNAWLKLSRSEALRLIGEHSWITIRNGEIAAAISLPLELFGRPGLYFNGEGRFQGGIRKGVIDLRIEKLSSANPNGAGIPLFIRALGSESLLGLLHLESVVPREFLLRCSAALSGDRLQLSCPSKQGENR
jgi:hypothetical protein